MSLSDSLHSVWSPETGCPPPEDWLRLETGEVTPEERRRLEEHAARCPACASEREMARLFAEAPEAGQDEDVDYVVARLESLNLPSQPVPLAFPARRPALAWAARLAALIVLAIGVALFFRAGAPPPLRDPGAGEVYRGGHVRPLGPSGEISEVPREFRWEGIEGARSYRVTLRAVDDAVLWQETVAAPFARLPEDVARSLHPAVLYRWSVEALDEQGARLAASEPVRFLVR
ncbi:MAG: zf-HC2 domain-containing protein [Thermoanaerobaculia bacterium]